MVRATDRAACAMTRLLGIAQQCAGECLGLNTSASIDAQEFYRTALGADTPEEPARQTRDAIRDNPGHQIWLAYGTYSLYGDPAATVSTVPGAGA